MENPPQSKVKKWIDCIATEDISGVSVELLEFINSDIPGTTLNSILFKLLQHLAHAAYKFHRSKMKLGKELGRISNLVCTNMSLVPNMKKFAASIYHIVACLVEMSLHHDAMNISNYLLPSNNPCKPDDDSIESPEIFDSTSNLWYKTAIDLLKSTRLTCRKDYDLFENIVKYQLNFTKLSRCSYSRSILSRILSYYRRMKDSVRHSGPNFNEEFQNFAIHYINNNGITLNDDESHRTWRLICELIPMMIGTDINEKTVQSKALRCPRIFEAFHTSARENRCYLAYLRFWERLCATLLKPVASFGCDDATEIDRRTDELEMLLEGTDITHKLLTERTMQADADWDQLVQWYCYAALLLLTSVLNYWEETAKTRGSTNPVTNDMLIAICKLVMVQSGMFAKFENKNCRCEMSTCQVNFDQYNQIALQLKCLTLISRCSDSMKSADLRDFARRLGGFIHEGILKLEAMGCAQWNSIWPFWGVAVYNLGVSCENKYHEISVLFYEYMYKTILGLVGFNWADTIWGLSDPLGTIFHRLCSVHTKHGNFHEAKRICSMNGLLSIENEETKAYRDWANIKHKEGDSSCDLPMIRYLRMNNELAAVNVSLLHYDIDKLCLREIRGLQEARVDLSLSIRNVLKEMISLSGTLENYAKGVQLLGYHMLNHQIDFSSIGKYLRDAIKNYERKANPDTNYRSVYAMLKLYAFIGKAQSIGRETEILMNTEQNRQDGSGEEKCFYKDIVPAYNTLSMRVTADLASRLDQCLGVWRRIVHDDWGTHLETWQIKQTLHALIIAGEYARLYYFQRSEIEAWKLAYKLANEINDLESVIYVTSRSLTSEAPELDWISKTNEIVESFGPSENSTTTKEITRYKLCLADFYYHNDEREMGEKLFVEATTKPELTFLTNFSNYLLKGQIEMNHRLGIESKDDQTEYTRMIVHCLYTILSMDDVAESVSRDRKERQLYECQMLLDSTNNLALRMNCLLSYREITAHLMRRLRTAQKLGLVMRVAECLKFLCYIDLSRAQLKECETKLQGLEYILENEAIEMTMRSKPPQAQCRVNQSSSPTLFYEPVRDLGENDASPVLRKKVFAKPDFMLHGNDCNCFKCTNTRYQYLLFACTHIRAQLFSLQRNRHAAMEHFHGALTIKRNILRMEDSTCVGEKNRRNTWSTSQRQRDAIEFIMLHIDYCRFLKWSTFADDENGRNIAQDALNLCIRYKLKNNPIYVSVQELLSEYRSEDVFTEAHYMKFAVPDINEMDNAYTDGDTLLEPTTCVTPTRETIPQKAISVRRRKTPPFLKLDRVQDDRTEDEFSIENLQAKRRRPVRRRISEDEDYSEDDEWVVGKKKSSLPRVTLTKPEESTKIVAKSRESSATRKKSVVADLSTDSQTLGTESKISELTDMVKDLTVKTNTKNSRTTRPRNKEANSEESPSANAGKKIGDSKKPLAQGSISKDRTSSKNPDSDMAKKTRDLANGLSLIDLSSDDSTATKSEPDLVKRRGRPRLRNKSEDVANVAREIILEKSTGDESNTDDEVVAISTRARRRLASSGAQVVATLNKVENSSRTRTTKK